MATNTGYVEFNEQAEPSAPAAGKQRLYIDSTTHKLKRTDSSGVDVTIESASSGGVATDPIWDAAGDLVQGTGADTAAKLSAGSAGQVLTSAGAAAANVWAGARGAKVYHNTTQATSDSTDIAVAYNSEDDDTNTNHDNVTANTRIVLNAIGRWRLTATHVFAASATGDRFGYFKVNGTAVRGKGKIKAAGTGETWLNYTTTVVAAAVTDYAEAWAIQTSTGALNLAADCTFEAYFIGR